MALICSWKQCLIWLRTSAKHSMKCATTRTTRKQPTTPIARHQVRGPNAWSRRDRRCLDFFASAKECRPLSSTPLSPVSARHFVHWSSHPSQSPGTNMYSTEKYRGSCHTEDLSVESCFVLGGRVNRVPSTSLMLRGTVPWSCAFGSTRHRSGDGRRDAVRNRLDCPSRELGTRDCSG